MRLHQSRGDAKGGGICALAAQFSQLRPPPKRPCSPKDGGWIFMLSGAKRSDYRPCGAKSRDRNSFAVGVHVDHGFMVAEIANDPQRPHALRPHIGERHRRAAVAGGRHRLHSSDTRPASVILNRITSTGRPAKKDVLGRPRKCSRARALPNGVGAYDAERVEVD